MEEAENKVNVIDETVGETTGAADDPTRADAGLNEEEAGIAVDIVNLANKLGIPKEKLAEKISEVANEDAKPGVEVVEKENVPPGTEKLSEYELKLFIMREDESSIIVAVECEDRKTLDNLDRQKGLNLILESDNRFAKWIHAGIEIDAGAYYYDPDRKEAVDPRTFKGFTIFRKDFKLARLP